MNKFKKLLTEICEKNKETLQKLSNAKIAAIDIKTKKDSGIALVVDDVKEETEALETSRNIKYRSQWKRSQIYIENVIMNPMGLGSRSIQNQRIGVYSRGSKKHELACELVNFNNNNKIIIIMNRGWQRK